VPLPSHHPSQDNWVALGTAPFPGIGHLPEMEMGMGQDRISVCRLDPAQVP